MKRWLSGTLAVALLAGPAAAQSPDARFARAVETIREAIREGASPSYAVAVARNGEIVYQAGFGWADRERRVAADEHTMYSLASISKPITATGLMILVEEGRVDLDAPINRYLAGAKLTGLAGDAEGATVRRVLSHMAGLPLHYEFFYDGEDHAEREMDAAIARYAILVNPPGEVYQYSNLGYGLLDEVVAQVSGMSYVDFMRHRVFHPLDLTRTAIHLMPALEPFAAQRYWSDGTTIPFYDFDHDGGSAVWSSAHDLVRFGMFHLDQDLAEQREILSEAMRERMREPQTPANENFLGYGLGWSSARDHGKLRVSHGGGMPGVSTVLNMYPEDDVVVVVLSNQSNGRVGRIAEELAAAVMPDYARQLEADRAQPREEREEEPFRPPSRLVGSWQGTLRTYERTVPMTLVVQPDGDVHARIDDQLTTLVNNPSFNDRTGQLTGRFVGTVPTQDARRHPHTVFLNVHLRNGRLAGQASAQTVGSEPYYFALTSYVDLGRQ